jgi:hypothetical protein
MANTNTTRRQKTSWADFYEAKCTEIASLKAVFDEPFKRFNETSLEMKVGANLAITIASHPFNFLILLTGKYTSLLVRHNQ